MLIEGHPIRPTVLARQKLPIVQSDLILIPAVEAMIAGICSIVVIIRCINRLDLIVVIDSWSLISPILTSAWAPLCRDIEAITIRIQATTTIAISTSIVKSIA